jgi:hypothetical protein
VGQRERGHRSTSTHSTDAVPTAQRRTSVRYRSSLPGRMSGRGPSSSQRLLATLTNTSKRPAQRRDRHRCEQCPAYLGYEKEARDGRTSSG